MAKINKEGLIEGSYQNAKGTVEVKLSVVQFMDGGCYVNYCPALDVYGYGVTEDDAGKSLGINMQEFFRYTMNKGTLHDDLISLGWNVKKQKKFIPPTFSSLLDNNPLLKKVFDTKNVNKVEAGFAIPAIA